MFNKKTILSILILVFIAAILYVLFFPVIYRHPDAPNPEESFKSTFKSPPGSPPISIRTDKPAYNYGENVNISVLKGYFSEGSASSSDFDDCKITIERTEDIRFGKTFQGNIGKINILENESQECKDYGAQFSFNLKNAEKNNLAWDQHSCENSLVPVPSIPDDYSIRIACSLSFLAEDRPSGIGDATNVRIEEPQSCKEKKIEIVKSEYNSKSELELEIKNAGASDVDNVKIFFDKCSDKRKIRFEKEIGGIRSGEIRTETIKQDMECKYESVSAHIKECYDRNENYWEIRSIANS